MKLALLGSASALIGAAAMRRGRHEPYQSVLPVVTREEAAGNTYTYVPLPDTSAQCLDGSQYGIYICKGTSNASWTLEIQGGGWCYDEEDCLGRSFTPLGSSSTWPAQAANMYCSPNSNTTYVQLHYCDGASFTGYREQGWPVPGNATAKPLMFRGIRNLDATLDLLFDQYGLDQAQLVVLTGGSAGGLSTFLHLDHVQERVTAVSPAARVVGNPVCGFFLDTYAEGWAPFNTSYTQELAYVYAMQNSSGSLSAECQSTLTQAPWQCIMAPHAAPFIKTPWFAFQSKFDHWQLSEELFLPCMQAQTYTPPYRPATCGASERISIQSYGYKFMGQFQQLMDAPGTQNGAFLDSCIIHGSTNSTIDGVTNAQAFQQWLAGGQQWYVSKCGNSTAAGPCDPSPICAPY